MSTPTRLACAICGRFAHPDVMKCAACGVVLHGEWEKPQLRGERLICRDCGPRLGLPDIRPKLSVEDCVRVISQIVWPSARKFR
jgi:hypothetical protein